MRVADWLLLKDPARTGKLTEEDTPGTTTSGVKITSAPVLLDMEMVTRGVSGAGFVSLAVQFVNPPTVRLLLVHVSEESAMEADRPMEAVADEPYADAESVEEPFAASVPVVIVNVAELLPAGAVTEAGAFSAVLLCDRAMGAPPAAAGPVRRTVQVVLALEDKVDQTHCNDEIWTEAVSLSPAVWL